MNQNEARNQLSTIDD